MVSGCMVNNFMDQAKNIKEITTRLERLEKAVFSDKPTTRLATKEKNFSGATGGIRLLISKKIFKKKQDLGSVKKHLESNNYYYSRQAIHEALKSLSKGRGILTAIEEGGKKVYVERK